MPDGISGDARSASNAIRRIAETLGCPVEAFYGAEPGSQVLTETAELMRLWSAIAAPEDRRRVLDCARAVVGGQAARRDGAD